MSRRMMSPQMLIKSQVADDKYEVDLNEILEKYGTKLYFDEMVDLQTITLQIYNKHALDEPQNLIMDDSGILGYVLVNGSITIGKGSDGTVLIQGMLHNNGVYIDYLKIPSGSYENGIILQNIEELDLYVIRV